MAIMHPGEFPTDKREEPDPQARLGNLGEEQVFNKLREKLSPEYHVWYDVKCVDSSKHQPKNIQMDFIVFHPNKGYLIIEVKKGQYKCFEENGVVVCFLEQRGYPKDKVGQKPHEQAMKNDMALLNLLGQKAGGRFIKQGWGVLLLDVKEFDHPPNRTFVDKYGFDADLERIDSWIEKLYKTWRNQDHAGEDQQFVFDQIHGIADPYIQTNPSLRSEVETNEIHCKYIWNPLQATVMANLKQQRKAAICGGAGTGKTILAVEYAKTLLSEDKRVLLVCFGNDLSRDILSKFSGQRNLKVFTFHHLCQYILGKFHLVFNDVERKIQKDKSKTNFYLRKILPGKILDYLTTEKVEREWDCVIADEGQDLEPEWFSILAQITGEDNQLIVFYDDYQNIYKGSINGSISGDDFWRFTLITNMRNTRQIFDSFRGFYAGNEYLPAGPDGEEMQTMALKNGENSIDKLNHVKEWIADRKQKGLSLNQIAVLVNDEKAAREQSQFLNGVFQVTNDVLDKEKLLITTMRKFKGQERDAIVLSDVDRAIDREFNELLYISMSRAKHYLYVVGEEKTIRRFREAGIARKSKD